MDSEIHTVHSQFILQHIDTINEIHFPDSYVCGKDLNLHIYHPPQVVTEHLKIFDPPEFFTDKQYQEHLQSEIRCRNFSDQDLSFLQPSQVHHTSGQLATPDIIEEALLLSQHPSSEDTPNDTVEQVQPIQWDPSNDCVKRLRCSANSVLQIEQSRWIDSCHCKPITPSPGFHAHGLSSLRCSLVN